MCCSVCRQCRAIRPLFRDDFQLFHRMYPLPWRGEELALMATNSVHNIHLDVHV